VLRAPLAVRRNFCRPFAALSLSAVAPGFARLRTGRAVGGFTGRSSSELSRMSSTSGSGVAGFSGLGVGWGGWPRETLLKKEVMGLYIGLGFPGDLAGDFCEAGAEALGEHARLACEPVGFESPRVPLETLSSVPLLARRGGGEGEPSPSESDESTTGCFRAARGLPIPPRIE
jgi:hypothetical protein